MANNKIRTFNRDGSDNIDRSNLRRGWNDIYHSILSLTWSRFFVITIVIYFLINLLFGFCYFLMGPEGLSGIGSNFGLRFFEECFFFSVQTFSTIGYGRVSPVGFFHNVLVAIEAFIGMLSISVMSGLLFVRFARPSAKIKFSDQALITQHRGQRCLIFRMANSRLNRIVEASVSMSVMLSSKTPEGEILRVQHDLPLIRGRSLFFALSWTVAHVIDDKSPLYQKTQKELEAMDAEIIVSVMGHDETFAQTIHARYSYIPSELVEDRQFADMIVRTGQNLKIDLAKISDLK